MKSRKQAWIVALCLTSALAIALAFNSSTKNVQAARRSTQPHSAAVAQPAAYVSSPSLAAALAADSMPFSSVGLPRVSGAGSGLLLPDAVGFTLAPPARSGDKTTLSVRFAESDAKRLPSQILITLARQSVLIERSSEDHNVFSTQVDFDWTAFLKMQQRRKELASEGKKVAIYKGRGLLRSEVMQFVDPSEIKQALQVHGSVQFTPDVLVGGVNMNVAPDHELMVIDTKVVEDGSLEQQNGMLGRTYDACIPTYPGNPNGAWTFQTLWMAAINTSSVQVAEQALDDFLTTWQNTKMINTFTVNSRPGMGSLGGASGLLSNWPTTSDTCYEGGVGGPCPSLQGPVRLNAIVNRIDLANQPGQNQAGELRFVFGVTAGTTKGDTCSTHGPPSGSPPPFNIILEYQVPSSYSEHQWADQWGLLPQDNFDFTSCPQDGCYIPMLQQLITDNVVKNNSCGGNTCLFHVRTNEFLLSGNMGTLAAVWELREFNVNLQSSGPNSITESTVEQSPDDSYNFGGNPCVRIHYPNDGQPPCAGTPTGHTSFANALTSWINNNYITINNNAGVLPLVPGSLTPPPPGIVFLGGSSLNGFDNIDTSDFAYWNTCLPNFDTNCTLSLGHDTPHYDARRYVSLNTCNGCHGFETANSFQHVFNRFPGAASNLSNFLLGCVNSAGACTASGSPGQDFCTIGQFGNMPGDQCMLNTPGQEQVPDPVNFSLAGDMAFGDIANRVTIMQGQLSPVNEFFLPFMRPRIGVH